MTVHEALEQADLPSAECEILFAHAARQTRTWVIAHAEDPLNHVTFTMFQDFVHRRKAHEPVAYIIGEQEFYGRTFRLNNRVLIPRPATEGLIDLALEFLDGEKEEVRELDSGITGVALRKGDISDTCCIVDIGTGCGTIAVTLACEELTLPLIATDIDDGILAMAEENAARHGVRHRIDFRKGMNLSPVADLSDPFLIVSNPPYIPSKTKLMPDVLKYEPHEALFAGPSGMDVITAIVTDAKHHPWCRGVILECGEAQTPKIQALWKET